MRYFIAIFTIAVLCAVAPGQTQAKARERAPRFADYPVTQLSRMHVAKPKVTEKLARGPAAAVSRFGL